MTDAHALSPDREYGIIQVRGWCTCGWRPRWCDSEALSDELVREHITHATGSCITYLMADQATCTSGDHTVTCGWDRAAAESAEREHECDGCRPAPTEPGARVCHACWVGIEHALADYGTFLSHLGGEDRAYTPESPARAALGPRVVIPAMQLDVDEADRLRSSGAGLTMTKWVASDTGAMDAVRFGVVAARVTRMHPWEEKQRALPTSRCPKCRMHSLVFHAPEDFRKGATIRCLRCSHVMDEDVFERYAAIEAQCCRACRAESLGCTDRSCRCHHDMPVPSWQRTAKPSSEEPYDPKKREHAHLDPLSLLTVPQLHAVAVDLDVPRFRQMRKPDLIAAIREMEEAS